MDIRHKLLYEAAYTGDVHFLNELLKQDKLLLDRVITTSEMNDNPLHIAAFLGHAAFAREIMKRKPTLARDLNAQGMSALHLAAAHGHLHVVAELVQVDSYLCYVRESKNGYLPVHMAVIKGKQDVIALLIKTCNDSVNVLTHISETIVHLAVKAKCSETFEFLTDQGITQRMLNSKDGNGNTILHLAFASRQQKIIKHLLSKADIDFNSINSAGFTPLDVLMFTNHEMGDLYIGEMLRAAGGKTAKELGVSEVEIINVSPIDGKTAKELGVSEIENINASPIDSSNPSDPNILSTRSINMTRTGSKIEDETYKNLEKNLIVVAALVATITYAAALNPPGGAIQMPFDDSNRNDTSWFRNWRNMDTVYPAGSPVYLWKLRKFFKYDYIALCASVLVILLSLPGPFTRNVIMRKLLLVMLWISVYCMIIAFNSALSILLYKGPNQGKFRWMTPSFDIWLYCFAFVSAPLFVDFTFSIIHTVKEKIKYNCPSLCCMTCPCADKIKQLIRWAETKQILLVIFKMVLAVVIGYIQGSLATST